MGIPHGQDRAEFQQGFVGARQIARARKIAELEFGALDISFWCKPNKLNHNPNRRKRSSLEPLTREAIAADPGVLSCALSLPAGEKLHARVLLPADGACLGHFFAGLSQAIRGVYGPHPLTYEEGLSLCGAIDYSDTLRFVAVDGEQIVAYFILVLSTSEKSGERYAGYGVPLDPATDCTLAPSVADAWLERGLGSTLFPHVCEAARRLGFVRMVLMGGVRADNPRAVHFYKKFGFRGVGDFWAGNTNNHDMVLELREDADSTS